MNTQRLTQQETARAADILKRGGLVGIPTETVYGLGADGLNSGAVAAIFQAKGRPQDNPLILHIPSADWLERYCAEIPPAAYTLAQHFWPGPLTMVLKRRPVVPDVVTAGLDTVGMRCPAHPVCRVIIAAAGVPVAAPSGNTSGRPSPTTAAAMLEDMDGKIDAIVDGGPCAVGVESTIVDLTCTPPRLLRPGGITLEQLEGALGPMAVDSAVRRQLGEGEQPRAPGMKYRHYAPKAPVTVVKGDPAETARYIAAHLRPDSGVLCFDEFRDCFAGYTVRSIGPAADREEQARRIFDALRAFDSTKVQEIWAQCPDDRGVGLAVANRLNKAAGFHSITLTEGEKQMESEQKTAPSGGEAVERACAALDQAGIAYERVDHPAVYTIEEMDALNLPYPEAVLKNLFLRDAKGKRHFLVCLPGHKQADLKTLGERIGSKLSFASEDRLGKYLGLSKGSVTPLGVLQDEARAVEVCLDEDIRSMPLVGVHPNLNTATVFLKAADLVRWLEERGTPLTWVTL